MNTVTITLVLVSTPALSEHPAAWAASWFTRAEREYCMGFRNPMFPLAARLCAKRAFQRWSALDGAATVKPDEIEILDHPFAPPELSLRGSARRVAAGRGVRATHLSLSHCQDYAGALLVVTADRSEGLG